MRRGVSGRTNGPGGISERLLAAPKELIHIDPQGQFKGKKITWRPQNEGRQSDILGTLLEMSGSMSKSSVRLITLEYLRRLLQSGSAAWVELGAQGPEFSKVLCSLPRSIPPAQILAKMPREFWDLNLRSPLVLTKENRKKDLLLPCQQYKNGVVHLSDVETRLTGSKIIQATQILEHGELHLHNLDRFEKVKQEAYVDDLTGLYNARYLRESLPQVIRQSNHLGQPFSVLFIDVDHFKSVNDQYGHLVGSEFLVALSQTVRSSVRDFDLAFRYGGDEFIVLLANADVNQAKMVAERIRQGIEKRIYKIKEVAIQSSVSIGVASYPLHASEERHLLKLADEAMYAAKRSSRNSVYLAVA